MKQLRYSNKINPISSHCSQVFWELAQGWTTRWRAATFWWPSDGSKTTLQVLEVTRGAWPFWATTQGLRLPASYSSLRKPKVSHLQSILSTSSCCDRSPMLGREMSRGCRIMMRNSGEASSAISRLTAEEVSQRPFTSSKQGEAEGVHRRYMANMVKIMGASENLMNVIGSFLT